MPILKRQVDLFPENLLEIAGRLYLPDAGRPDEQPRGQQDELAAEEPQQSDAELQAALESFLEGRSGRPTWWVLYSLAQQEKKLMRWLHAKQMAFYCPLYEKRWRAAGGRVRKSYLPLFSSYVFLFGDELDRYEAMTSGCVSRWIVVPAPQQLTVDLKQIHKAIASGQPLVPERELTPGRRVRVRSGQLKGLEGVIVRRHGQTRLVVAVNFIQQGASLEVDECELELVDDDWHARHGLRRTCKQNGKAKRKHRRRPAAAAGRPPQ